MPSFRPLSTFRPSRMRVGTDVLVTTALPRAASVGRQHGGQNGDLQQGQPVEYQQAGRDPEQDGQRQPEHQQATGVPDAV
jgi:hypothetical protein